MLLVEWKTTEYNYGGHFDGSYFTAPEDGIYSFYLTSAQASIGSGYAYIYVNSNEIARSKRSSYNSYSGNVSVFATIKLQQNDKVKAQFKSYLYNLNDSKTTYFEGRLISKLEIPVPRYQGPRVGWIGLVINFLSFSVPEYCLVISLQ